MNINYKNILLYTELLLILGPITLALCYVSLMSFFVGVPSLLLSALDSATKLDIYMLLAVIGNLLGIFSVIVLWTLVKATLKGAKYEFYKQFKFALVAGVLASIILVILYKFIGFIFIVLPIAIVALHSIYLQNNLSKQ